jgi:predicted DNA-binding protein (MmcQ/YjbR family)
MRRLGVNYLENIRNEKNATNILIVGRTYQKYRKLFLAKPGAEETFPFGPQVAVYKVKGKMFATLAQDDGVWSANLKCDPIWAQSLRKKYPSIQPGYHMNKRHWNRVVLDGSLPPSLIRKMVEVSYVLVSPAK